MLLISACQVDPAAASALASASKPDLRPVNPQPSNSIPCDPEAPSKRAAGDKGGKPSSVKLTRHSSRLKGRSHANMYTATTDEDDAAFFEALQTLP